MTIALKGERLTLDIPGEPQYQLIPNLDGGFTLKEYQQMSLRFVTGDSGKVSSVSLKRPSGIVSAKRMN
jgi:hypothetical protein